MSMSTRTIKPAQHSINSIASSFGIPKGKAGKHHALQHRQQYCTWPGADSWTIEPQFVTNIIHCLAPPITRYPFSTKETPKPAKTFKKISECWRFFWHWCTHHLCSLHTTPRLQKNKSIQRWGSIDPKETHFLICRCRLYPSWEFNQIADR